MKDLSPLAVIWRRKWLVLGVVAAVVITTTIVSKSLQKVYSTHSTLLVAQTGNDQSFDRVQASQAFARSYAEIIGSPNIARLVARRVGGSSGEIRDASTFEVIPDTQLLEITSEDPDPRRAKAIADAYATEFIAYARSSLGQTTQATVTLADSAPVPTSPARPKPTLYVLLAAILGLTLAIALAFLRDRLDQRLRTAEEVEARFEPAILARVPRRGRSSTTSSAFVESYRLLRTNLQFAAAGKTVRSIAVTSGHAGEGKTTTTAQLAIASAESGIEVVVVEADFRRPALQRSLMPDRQEPLRPGFSNYLVGTTSVDEILHPTGLPGISIVPAGPLPPTPSALLDSNYARRIGPELLERAELVIFDCPPLTVGADASVLASRLDGTLMVIDLEESTDRSVRDSLSQLATVGAEVLGLVLNKDSSLEMSSYDYYSPGATASGTKESRGQRKSRRRALAGSGRSSNSS